MHMLDFKCKHLAYVAHVVRDGLIWGVLASFLPAGRPCFAHGRWCT